MSLLSSWGFQRFNFTFFFFSLYSAIRFPLSTSFPHALFFNAFSSSYPFIIFPSLFLNTFSSIYSFMIFSSLFFNTFSSVYPFIIFSSLFFNTFSSIYSFVSFPLYSSIRSPLSPYNLFLYIL